MRPAPAALAAFLAAAEYDAWMADLYVFQLTDGLVLRYSGGNTAVTVPAAGFADPHSLNYGSAQTFLLGPRFGRSQVSTKIGVEPAELDIEIYAAATDLIGTFAFADAVRIGLFDGATVELDRLIGAAPGDTSLGCLTWFYGRVAECDIGRSTIAMKVKSLMNLLAIQQMPRRLFAASCSHIFGDPMCGYNRQSGTAADGTTGGPAQITVTATTTAQSGVYLASAISPNIFDYVEGTLVGLSGANAGIARTIASISPDGKTLAQFKPWLYPVAVGDTFYALPGCDHSTTGEGGCQLRNNLGRFGGFPYIPPPEMAF
ncbi:MAG TPA: DUF2163 domain-containing protein [Stellaceae bacterium]|nr:DUF2163 domain-containing protein [Stellaceae bacterium]